MLLTLKKRSYKLTIILTITLGVIFTSRVFAVSEITEINKRLVKTSFTTELPSLNNMELDQFILGKSFFKVPWVASPSVTTARDGLGPLFNANTCINCHKQNGRGKVFHSNESVSRSNIIKLSILSNKSPKHKKQKRLFGFVKEPSYGSQININGISNVDFEAKPNINYTKIKFTYPDGKEVILSKPILKMTQLNYGNLHEKSILSARIAQPLIGLGLVEQISDEQILQNEDILDANSDGISGKANRIWSKENNKIEIGRYTWKASISTVKNQVANAALNDMGLTNPIYKIDNCTQIQKTCIDAPKGKGDFDLPEKRLEAITFYLTHLKIPKRKKIDNDDEKLFNDVGCSGCHKANYDLPNNQRIYPYSDFLLHDMGESLSDNRKEFDADGKEWRTAPLWYLSNTSSILGEDKNYLHDGRAKTIEEAILWHGGEANISKKLFTNLSQANRLKVINFVNQI
ncbi:MAG: hypothetical protein OSA79_03135 [Candidatus Thioglobus sp.]|jgi:CxxC motif-containing protein (DUF1111 family)|nr:hypothetical protein [Candidatus Thioglobus sp.]CAI8283539.1 MAG: Uncharacterised protein [Flavobacteriaceae bacterium]|tara:strand:+ start:1690 stop:3069 length:1380 start_codon:yes stop_codon:yes gene_type:complete